MNRRIIISLIIAAALLGGTAVALAMEKKVKVVFSDRPEEIQISGYYETLSEALASKGYNLKKLKSEYRPSVPWNQSLKDEMKVLLTCHCEVTMIENGQVKGKFKTTASTVDQFLQTKQIQLTKYDKVWPAANQKIKNNMTIYLDRAEKKVKKEVKTIPYQIKKIKDPTLPYGEEEVKIKGKEGKEVYQVTTLYKKNQPIVENGKPVVTKKLVKKVEAVDKVVKIGINKKIKPDMQTAADEKGCRQMKAEVTAYTYYPGENITYSGEPVRRGAIAVDPKVIPLHSRIYVPGYGWGEALDTGGRIKGNIIDVFMESKREALAWGKPIKTIKVCPPK
ncbi:3D domain-containing protein [Thermoflavimicrobium dichotomicum]|uniref:3D (Asp-Asp-Asp) domain-containing protein n=1 Tax=Thermoflavimicrobium dichotomicum TaxID=46223 RepID=A0A1I3NCD1_9BACL|nr:3D domain-containing protein [Thermoflavimicrobium dichotomicum]SFJ06835.1 3D (Asp-Asp-Asp) domain-containing protein [Thermoflavimicrobium dichotomicum]